MTLPRPGLERALVEMGYTNVTNKDIFKKGTQKDFYAVDFRKGEPIPFRWYVNERIDNVEDARVKNDDEFILLYNLVTGNTDCSHIPEHHGFEEIHGPEQEVLPAEDETPLPPSCNIPTNALPALTTADIVRPAVTALQAIAAWEEFQALKKAVINKSDLQKIGDKEFVKKSGWRKLAQYFNLTDQIIDEKQEFTPDGKNWTWTVKVRCIASNGRTTEGVGKCSTLERKFAHVEHDTYATAHTRAKNRAISDMIAAGEVSAEEVSE